MDDHFHRAHPILFRCFARGEVLDAFLTSAVVLWLNMPADRQYDGEYIEGGGGGAGPVDDPCPHAE